MMRLSAEAKVGLVVIVGVLILTYMTFTVGGYRFGRETGYRLYAIFDTIAGLDAKSSVKVAGVEVGKVEDIILVDGKARVTLRIQPEIQLRLGSQAAIRATGLLGEKYVELLPGSEETLLQDGDTLAESQQAADLDQLINQFSLIAVDIKAVSASFREALGTDEGEKSLKEIVANIRELTRNLNRAVKDSRENFTVAIANIREASDSFKDDLPDLMASLRRTSEKLEIITTRLEEGDGTIGKLMADEEIYDQLSVALKGVGGAVSRLERYKTTVGFRNEFQFEESENKGYFSLKLQPRSDKFYLLELVDDPRGKIARTTITDPLTGAVIGDSLKSKRKLKFSVLFGRRFSDLTLRIGLMENTFGLGTDLLLFDDALGFSLDAWEFSSDDPLSDRIHLKATARFSFFKYLYVHGGYDNFLNDQLDTGFVGGGIRFEDDDLKYLIGSGALR